MKVRNIVRKAAALGAGAGMLGMTLAGAFAYDLSSYPQNKFIVDGRFDGSIVIGEKAATSDVVGAIDIAASLQGASVSKVALPGSAGEVSLSGENFKLSTGGDQLELREPVGEVVDTVTESDLPGLKSGRITTSEGDTEYFQYLRFKDASNLQNMTVNYVENDDDVMSDYLVVDTDSPFLEWEIQFPEGLESERTTGSGAQDLEDIEDRSFNILGTDFSIVRAQVDVVSDNFEMILMGGSIADTLREGETRTYSIDGVDYEVTLVFVSDPNSGSANPEAKFSVNGELTQALSSSDTDTLSGGLQIGVRDILVNSREGVASFFLGADKVVFTDADTDGSNDFDGDVEINNENINDGEITVLGSFVDSANSSFEITSIKYRLTMDAEDGTTAFIPSGKGIREFMKRPESLISESLDVRYEGLTQPERTELKIRPKGDDEYRMTFTNIQGQEYSFPLLSNKDGTWKFGDQDDELVFVESGSSARFNIGREDYFVVSNDRGAGDADKSVTNVLRYEDYDETDRTLELQNVATGGAVNVPIDTNGNGSLVIGGHTYKVSVSDYTAAEPTLSIDLNADSTYNDVIKLTAWGGVVIDLLNNSVVNSTVNISSTSTVGIAAIGDLGNFTGNGETLEGHGDPSDQAVTIQAKVLSKNFDSSDNSVDELFTWTISEVASGNEVDLDFSESNYAGPLEGSTTDVNEFQFNELENDDETEVGMTDYGILIKEHTPSGSSEPNELTLSIPKEQVFAQVFVTLGTTETLQGAGAGTADVVNPIAVGLAVLDRDAPALGAENLIIVGGPCANTAAAAFLGNPENCAEGFEPGKAMIVAKEYGTKVAVLVAGYEATETQGASRVLAAYKDYSLAGTEVEVVVASLNDISVKAAGSDSMDS